MSSLINEHLVELAVLLLLSDRRHFVILDLFKEKHSVLIKEIRLINFDFPLFLLLDFPVLHDDLIVKFV
jgi:hypothetical protein